MVGPPGSGVARHLEQSLPLLRFSPDEYTIPDRSDAAIASIRTAARQEIGIRRFLEEGNYSGFTDTFEDLHGFDQLPGLAAQRLRADGHGFGAEGDWKTAALLHSLKVMACGLPGGVSFMEGKRPASPI